MALINCPECGKQISDKAISCPNCGYPINFQNQQVQQNQEEYLCCPKCGSRELHAEHKGFSGGKALAGALVTGGIGLLAGTIGSKETQITCLKCGNKFKAGEAKVVRNNMPASNANTIEVTYQMCRTCGYIHEDSIPPEKCPVCKEPATNFKILTLEKPNLSDEEAEIINIINSQGKLGAVKWYKDAKNCDLMKAKDTVEEIMAKYPSEIHEPSGTGCSVIVLIGLSLGALALI